MGGYEEPPLPLRQVRRSEISQPHMASGPATSSARWHHRSPKWPPVGQDLPSRDAARGSRSGSSDSLRSRTRRLTSNTRYTAQGVYCCCCWAHAPAVNVAGTESSGSLQPKVGHLSWAARCLKQAIDSTRKPWLELADCRPTASGPHARLRRHSFRRRAAGLDQEEGMQEGTTERDGCEHDYPRFLR